MGTVARVLIVDDDSLVLETIAGFLEDAPYEYKLANSARAALEVLEGGNIDSVVTDILMPDMDGIEFIRAIRDRWPHLWVVAMSGGGSRMGAGFNLQVSSAFGADRVLFKPMAQDEFLASLIKG